MFRASCEATLRVLRQHRDTYLSLAETFVFDPFVDWVKGQQNQGRGADA